MEDQYNQYRLVKSYRDDKILRESFCSLADRTFGIDFEEWYQKGYWKDDYNPYSIVYNGKVVASVSVNLMPYRLEGVCKSADKDKSKSGKQMGTDLRDQMQSRNYIQLGTVMTDPEYRRKGLIRRIMMEIWKDYDGKTDGYFLFANDSVLDFYPKFGFRRAKEFQYEKALNCTGACSVKSVSMDGKGDWDFMEAVIAESVPNSAFYMKGNVGLTMFYLAGPMRDSVYYVPGEDAYVVAEREGDTLILDEIYANHAVNPDKIGKAFGTVGKMRLGFTPLDKEKYEKCIRREEDTTLFFRGIDCEEFERAEMMYNMWSKSYHFRPDTGNWVRQRREILQTGEEEENGYRYD